MFKTSSSDSVNDDHCRRGLLVGDGRGWHGVVAGGAVRGPVDSGDDSSGWKSSHVWVSWRRMLAPESSALGVVVRRLKAHRSAVVRGSGSGCRRRGSGFSFPVMRHGIGMKSVEDDGGVGSTSADVACVYWLGAGPVLTKHREREC